jgi:hypothetical protein
MGHDFARELTYPPRPSHPPATRRSPRTPPTWASTRTTPRATSSAGTREARAGYCAFFVLLFVARACCARLEPRADTTAAPSVLRSPGCVPRAARPLTVRGGCASCVEARLRLAATAPPGGTRRQARFAACGMPHWPRSPTSLRRAALRRSCRAAIYAAARSRAAPRGSPRPPCCAALPLVLPQTNVQRRTSRTSCQARLLRS